MKYRAYHYDMDGVLANSEPLHEAVEKQTCLHYGLDVDMSTWEAFKGMTAEAIFGKLHAEHVMKHGDRDIPTVEELIAHKTDAFIDGVWDGAIDPIDGASDLVRWTHGRADAQTLVTSSSRRVQQAVLRYLNLDRFFDEIVTGDDVVSGKPNPEPYVKALGKVGARAEESLVFEDSKNGIRAALGAKCAVMALTSAYHSREQLAVVNPTFIVDNWFEAPRIIERS